MIYQKKKKIFFFVSFWGDLDKKVLEIKKEAISLPPHNLDGEGEGRSPVCDPAFRNIVAQASVIMHVKPEHLSGN